MERISASLLMCSAECYERQCREEHIDFLNQRWRERTILRVEGRCLLSAD